MNFNFAQNVQKPNFGGETLKPQTPVQIGFKASNPIAQAPQPQQQITDANQNAAPKISFIFNNQQPQAQPSQFQIGFGNQQAQPKIGFANPSTQTNAFTAPANNKPALFAFNQGFGKPAAPINAVAQDEKKTPEPAPFSILNKKPEDKKQEESKELKMDDVKEEKVVVKQEIQIQQKAPISIFQAPVAQEVKIQDVKTQEQTIQEKQKMLEKYKLYEVQQLERYRIINKEQVIKLYETSLGQQFNDLFQKMQELLKQNINNVESQQKVEFSQYNTNNATNSEDYQKLLIKNQQLEQQLDTILEKLNKIEQNQQNMANNDDNDNQLKQSLSQEQKMMLGFAVALCVLVLIITVKK